MKQTQRNNRLRLGKDRISNDMGDSRDAVRKADTRNTGLEDFIISVNDDDYEYPNRQSVPSGEYISAIKAVSARVKDEKRILDIGYEFVADDGRKYHVLQSYPLDSIPLRKFYKAMIAAGVNVGDSVEKLIGVKEKIVLTYPSQHIDIGCITAREPVKDEKGESPVDDDDEFDDFESYYQNLDDE